MQTNSEWWRIVSFGSYAVCPLPPQGPWQSREKAEAALDRFLRRLGPEAGSFMAATSTRIVGPFRTRTIAQGATMANYTHRLEGRARITLDTPLSEIDWDDANLIDEELIDTAIAGDDWGLEWSRVVRAGGTVKDLRDDLYTRAQENAIEGPE